MLPDGLLAGKYTESPRSALSPKTTRPTAPPPPRKPSARSKTQSKIDLAALDRPENPRPFQSTALQLTTLLLAAILGALVYRLCQQAYDRHIGLTAGVPTGLATPTLLWASIPKRNVSVATLTECSLYLLDRSRTAERDRWYRRFRLLPYVPVGLSAWCS
jgi:hypothetical protein